MNRGSLAETRAHEKEGTPSMRPRFMNRGSQVREARRRLASGPSMRPRFMNRGSYEELEGIEEVEGLQ